MKRLVFWVLPQNRRENGADRHVNAKNSSVIDGFSWQTARLKCCLYRSLFAIPPTHRILSIRRPLLAGVASSKSGGKFPGRGKMQHRRDPAGRGVAPLSQPLYTHRYRLTRRKHGNGLRLWRCMRICKDLLRLALCPTWAHYKMQKPATGEPWREFAILIFFSFALLSLR